jgi:Rhodopirellula transposase DDE domain
VVSVDTKKKELIGNYSNGGREWHPVGEPTSVNVHDFADRTLGEFAKAIPYGVYDIGADEGWVNG